MFNHDFLPQLEIPRVNKGGVRYYQTPAGEYPSVTTILKEFYNKDKIIQEWKDRIGEKEAEKISLQARTRGTNLHNICERFLLNEPNFKEGHMPYTINDFLYMKKLLVQNIGKIYGIELPLYSKTLMTAGTSDLVCEWNGINSIVDYKTSRKEKQESWIEDYFVQSTIYGMMVNELFDLDIKQIVIVFMIEHEFPQVFVKPLTEYKEKALEVCISNRPAHL